jgi:glutaredoxin
MTYYYIRLEKRKMRENLVKRKDIGTIKLPNIFLNKSVFVNKFNKKRPNAELKY